MLKIVETHPHPVNTPDTAYFLNHRALPCGQTELQKYSPILLTVHDVSRILNIHVNTVRRWSNQGVFKPIRIGPRGDRRYRLKDLTDFLLTVESSLVPPKK